MSQIDYNAPRSFKLGDWVVEPDRNTLSCNGRTVKVENKSMDVLVLLASRAGDVVSNDDAIKVVWKGRPMGENPVYKCIANLRQALGDDPRAPRYIETIARRGYRLVAEMSPLQGSATDPVSSTTTGKNALLGAIGAVVVIAITLSSLRQDNSAPFDIGTEISENSIAVMPFENLSKDPDNDYFGHGIADELLNRLAQMPGLRIVARNSSFSLGNKVDDIPGFANSLGVHYILSGSVRQSDASIRVNARLLDLNGTMVWSNSYDRNQDNIVTLQDDVANAIAAGLALNAGESFLRNPERTTSFDAYSAYLLGSELQKRRSSGWGPLAVAAFEDAIRLDQDYAAAYAGLATSLLLSNRENAAVMQEADVAVEAALRLNPYQAEAHEAAGLSAMWKGSAADYEIAEAAFRRALEFNSSLVDARNWLSITLQVMGKRAESLKILEEALGIDPLNPILNMNLGRRFQADGRLDAAREQMVNALDYPDTPAYVRSWIAEVEMDAGQLDSALGWIKRAVNDGVFDNDKNIWYAGEVATIYAALGMTDQADRWLAASRLPLNSHWLLGHVYRVSIAQQKPSQFEESIRNYESSLGDEQALTLYSRSLIGRHAVRVGDYSRGIRYLEPIFSEGWTFHNAPGGSDSMISTLHFYAVALQQTGQLEKAKELLEDILAKQSKSRLGRSRILGKALAREAVTYLLLGDEKVALERIEQAVDANWRYYYLVPGNPCWDGLKDNPEFQSLLAAVKQDIDLQRVRVRAEEQVEPFLPPDI